MAVVFTSRAGTSDAQSNISRFSDNLNETQEVFVVEGIISNIICPGFKGVSTLPFVLKQSTDCIMKIDEEPRQFYAGDAF